MEYAIGVALLWGLMLSFWLDAESRAAKSPLQAVTVVGRELDVYTWE